MTFIDVTEKKFLGTIKKTNVNCTRNNYLRNI